MTPRLHRWSLPPLLLGALAVSCGVGKKIPIGVASEETPRGAGGSDAGGASSRAGTEAGSGAASAITGGSTGSGGADSGGSGGTPRIDAGPYDAGAPVPACGTGSVRQTALCERFPAEQMGSLVKKWRLTMPLSLDRPALVANLTDDNQDGRIDTCDTPDVLVVDESTSRMVLVDGATGVVERTIETPIAKEFVPAIADLDGDGTPEIVAVKGPSAGALPDVVVAFSNVGAELWAIGSTLSDVLPSCGGVFIRDLEGDGRAEVLVGTRVIEASGEKRFQAGIRLSTECMYTTAADLDGDGHLEVLTDQIYSNTGEPRGAVPMEGGAWFAADMMDDATPELVRITEFSARFFRPDGTELDWGLPTECPAELPMLLDFNRDGKLDIGYGACGVRLFSLPELDMWTITADYVTAFDLQGTGTPMLISTRGFRGDQDGKLYFRDARRDAEETVWDSYSLKLGRPVVADVDADGSADIVMPIVDYNNTTSLVVISHQRRRWVPARRIWNQAAYMVDAVNEDGTPSRPRLGAGMPNGLGVNARLENGRICTGTR